MNKQPLIHRYTSLKNKLLKEISELDDFRGKDRRMKDINRQISLYRQVLNLLDDIFNGEIDV